MSPLERENHADGSLRARGCDAVHIRSYATESAAHAHDHHQVVIPIRGAMEIEVDGKGGRLQRGARVFVPAGARHAFRGLGENRFVVVDLAAGAADGAPVFAALDGALARLVARVDQRDARFWLAAFRDLLLPPCGKRPRDSRARRAMKALEVRADALPAIAREAGASTSHLHALFAREAGIGPAGWRRALRLARAAELLRDTALPVAAIGAACGYGDPAAFARAFARRYAVPPSAYRARFS